MALTDTTLRSIKPARLTKPKRYPDQGGLHLYATPTGGMSWRYKYRFAGKEKLLTLGQYPDVGLAAARDKHIDARRLLSAGTDPAAEKRRTRRALTMLHASTFAAIYEEWLAKKKKEIGPKQIANTIGRFREVNSCIGNRPISEITAPEILDVLKRIEKRGAVFTAKRVGQQIGEIFRYAIATDRATFDPMPSLKGALSTPPTKNMPALTAPADVAELLRSFDGFRGSSVVQAALLLAPLVFVRPGELRQAKWADIDLDRAEWKFLASKTKTEHQVPLATQAVAILRDLHKITGHRAHAFTGRDPLKPMSEAAVNAALRRLGWDTKREITGHGFRAMARTILHEVLDIAPAVIEHQLAHAVPDTLGSAYNRTKFLPQRKVMMQRWADYLEKLKAGADVIPIKGAA
ncbi:MAG: integrase arm-type DNA-binding domain-containing protein [Sulfuritalea sp.]|nr:integrase arm-type DNA-binding domain-containing protein [Sulfuritalea sp.]